MNVLYIINKWVKMGKNKFVKKQSKHSPKYCYTQWHTTNSASSKKYVWYLYSFESI